MTVEELTALCGIITSLLFSYFPVIDGWFAAQPPNTKRLVQIGVAVVVSGAMYGLGCAGMSAAFTCDWPGALVMIRLLVVFIIANQAAYAISPRA